MLAEIVLDLALLRGMAAEGGQGPGVGRHQPLGKGHVDPAQRPFQRPRTCL